MIATEDIRLILCDTPGCGATAELPVALRLTLSVQGAGGAPDGWLFVRRGDAWAHYCPRCVAARFEEDENGPAGPWPRFHLRPRGRTARRRDEG